MPIGRKRAHDRGNRVRVRSGVDGVLEREEEVLGGGGRLVRDIEPCPVNRRPRRLPRAHDPAVVGIVRFLIGRLVQQIFPALAAGRWQAQQRVIDVDLRA